MITKISNSLKAREDIESAALIFAKRDDPLNNRLLARLSFFFLLIFALLFALFLFVGLVLDEVPNCESGIFCPLRTN